MAKKDKLVQRFLSVPSDFTWDELLKVLSVYGFSLYKSGKTGGSSRTFANADGVSLVIHEPHTKNIVHKGILRVVQTVERKRNN
jgi:hypothetical protein